MTYEIHHGDCLDILPTIKEPIAAVVTDPPYGIANRCDYRRFSGGLSPSRNFHEGIKNDNRPFDPTHWLEFDKVILWGYQFFADKLPQGTVLVWSKRRDNQLNKFLSDCELGWMKGGKGCYEFRHIWNGFDRESERRQKSLHPSQKPVALMRWCLERLKLSKNDTVLDPYCGSGSVGLACMELGLNYIGIDIKPKYCEISKQRLEKVCDESYCLSA